MFNGKKIDLIAFNKGCLSLLYILISIFFFLPGFTAHAGEAKEVVVTVENDPLTPEEINWLKRQNNQISVSFAYSYPPFEFVDKNGDYKGISFDLLKLIGKKLNVKFVFKLQPNYENTISSLNTDEIQLLASMNNTEKRREFLNFTPGYAKFPAVIISKNEFKKKLTLSSLKGKKVTVANRLSIHDYLLENYPEIKLISVLNEIDAIRLISYGKFDAAVINLAVVKSFMHKKPGQEINIVGITDFNENFSFASAKNNPLLSNILAKGLKLVTKEEKEKIINKWVNLNHVPVKETKEFKILLIYIIFVFLILIIVGVLIGNKSLRTLVQVKTRKFEESEYKFKALFEQSFQPIALLDLSGTILDINRNALIITAKEELIGIKIWDTIYFNHSREKQEKVKQAIEQSLEGKVLRLETSAKFDDQEINYDFCLTPVKNEEGKVIFLIAEAWNIERLVKKTEELKKSRIELEEEVKIASQHLIEEIAAKESKEEELEELKRHKEFILKVTKTLLVILDYDYNIRHIDDHWKELYGEIGNKKCYEYFQGKKEPCAFCVIRKALETKKVAFCETVSSTDATCAVQLTAIPFQTKKGEWLVAELKVDISQKKKAEQELVKYKEHLEQIVHARTAQLENELEEREKIEAEIRETKSRLFNIINSVYSAIISLDSEGLIIDLNINAQQIARRSLKEAVGKPINEVFPDYEFDLNEIKATIQNKIPAIQKKISRRIAGVNCIISQSIFPLLSDSFEGAVIKFEDITEKSRLEEMIAQSEKMESLGGLIAGMAHEINNPLAIITQTIQNIQRRVKPDLKANIRVAEEFNTRIEDINSYLKKRNINEYIETVREAGVRISKIINSISNLSHSNQIDYANISFKDLLENSIQIAVEEFDFKNCENLKELKINKKYIDDELYLNCISLEIEEVLLNIFKNSLYALCHRINLDLKPEIVVESGADESQVWAKITDNGDGMTLETQKRAFEPFFTTKPVGTGIGLGLYISYFIITQKHKGKLVLESRPGTGTSITVFLPKDLSYNSSKS